MATYVVTGSRNTEGRVMKLATRFSAFASCLALAFSPSFAAPVDPQAVVQSQLNSDQFIRGESFPGPLMQSILTNLNNGSVAGSASAPMTADGVFNLNAAAMPKWRAALARVRNGSGRARVVFIGDSTMMGTGAGTGGTNNYNAAFIQSWPQQLVSVLNKSVTTSSLSLLGDQNLAGQVAYSTYDPRVTLGANWAFNGQSLVGGNAWLYTSGAVNNFSFTPPASIDTISISFIANGFGTATINVDGGGSLGTLNGAAAGGLTTQTFTVTAGAHTINVVPNNNGNFYIVSIVSYLSTSPAIDILQGASSGSLASYWTAGTNNWQGINELIALAPDLTIVCLTINDSNNGTPLSSYSSTMQQIVTAGKTTGDVLLMAGPPSNTAAATNGTLANYINVLQQLSVTNNVPLISVPQRWTSYVFANATLPYYDNLHPGKLGYNDIAAAVSQVLLNP